MNSIGKFKRKQLTRSISMATISALMLSGVNFTAAQETTVATGEKALEQVVVTATRRDESILEIPINITAVSANQIEDLRLTGISEIARYVPGLVVLDRGPRDEVPDILVRGLNTTGNGPGFVSDTVAIYFGDIPLDSDIKPVDLERVEVLIGCSCTYWRGL